MKSMTLTGLLATLCVLLAGFSVASAQAPVWVPPGPAVGSTFPDALALVDQAGRPQSLKQLMGQKGAAIFFVRSADWCPFCKRQLVDLNGRLAEFKALGLSVLSVSHDEAPLIAEFHKTQSIGYTMLADPSGTVVEKLGIRDLQYADGTKAYGVARPMIFIVTPAMTITHKYAEESYQRRPDLNKVLTDLRAD